MLAEQFTIEEANALVPRLTELVGEQLAIAEEIQDLVSKLWKLGTTSESTVHEGMEAEVLDITVYPQDSGEVRELKRDLAERVEAYREGWDEVEATGAVVKDTSSGLLDFFGNVDGRAVWLCWQFGEDAVEHYHELYEGYDERKPLGEVRERQLN